jgi:hypothetical protein
MWFIQHRAAEIEFSKISVCWLEVTLKLKTNITTGLSIVDYPYFDLFGADSRPVLQSPRPHPQDSQYFLIFGVSLYFVVAKALIIWVLINKSFYWAFIYFLLIICITEHSIYFTDRLNHSQRILLYLFHSRLINMWNLR